MSFHRQDRETRDRILEYNALEDNWVPKVEIWNMVQIQRPQRITLMYLHLPIGWLKNCEVKWGLLILRNTVLPSKPDFYGGEWSCGSSTYLSQVGGNLDEVYEIMFKGAMSNLQGMSRISRMRVMSGMRGTRGMRQMVRFWDFLFPFHFSRPVTSNSHWQSQFFIVIYSRQVNISPSLVDRRRSKRLHFTH